MNGNLSVVVLITSAASLMAAVVAWWVVAARRDVNPVAAVFEGRRLVAWVTIGVPLVGLMVSVLIRGMGW